MPEVRVFVPDVVTRVLDEQARTLLLGRRQYVRALLAAIANQAAERTVAPDTLDQEASADVPR